MVSQPIRVGVYSPQDVVTEGLVSLLSRHPDRICLVPTPTRHDEPDPDVVLYDVMALLDGDTKPLAYLVEMTTSKVLAVGRDLRPDLLGQALATGADGFFSMGVDEEELVAAVESAATGWEEGDTGENPTIGSSVSEARAQLLGAHAGLSDREVEVLTRIAMGLSNQQIAAELFLSINSVKTYVRTAYRKIGADSRAGAVSWAIRHGFTAERDVATRTPNTA
jgi:DNA-binding NarL/FixJ family response regulator